ncbi:Hcp family type VI secretion system effector [Desulfosarcina sp.]|uniref:Hcp family type VI secretion system effector n=1 Tax=Desulfosarcina sp. TaxID=2027861 RepID=UPI003970AFC0
MAVDMFLKIDGIKGESADDKHKDEIHVLAWSWGASQSGTRQGGGGGGKANFQDVSVTKFVDKSSHSLLKAVSTGQHFKEALLTVRKAGDKPLEYIKLTMKDCMISSLSTGGSGGDDKLTENISINFGQFGFEYTPQKADGSGDAVLPFGFDIKANKVK